MAVSNSNSFGRTTTPKLGWGCCTLPPCCCSENELYFSDNHRTWATTAIVQRGCCPCSPMVVDNVRYSHTGNPYRYESAGCCSADVNITVNNKPVGTFNHYCHCCPGGKIIREAKDSLGNSKYVERAPECQLCGGGECCPATRGCCDPWSRYDLYSIEGPEGSGNLFAATVVNQHRKFCTMCFPAWTGFEEMPAQTEEEQALLGAWLLFNSPMYPMGYPHNLMPATLGMQ